MKNKLLILIAASSVSLLFGCSSNSVKKCPIDQAGYPQCSSMEEVFNDALNDNGDHLSVLPKVSVSDEDSPLLNGDGGEVDNSNPDASRSIRKIEKTREIVENPYKAKPVYIPEKVHRMWFSPWKDKSNNLHSSEIIYFTTKGYWSYGTLDEQGVAGGAVMEPLSPDDLGFSPDFTASKEETVRKHVKPEVTLIDGGK